jgi:homoserine kinase type II
MSVYTRVERDELERLLSEYAAGTLVAFEGIHSGTDNTNYFVSTDAGRYVLTLFEKLSAEDLPFFLDLTAHLADHGVPCAHPVADRQGRYLRTLKGKPAALVMRLRGWPVDDPGADHCAAVGTALAQLHLAATDFPAERANAYGFSWMQGVIRALSGQMPPADASLMGSELEELSTLESQQLPRGIVHADLFRDNVLFDEDALSGIIDFYFACTDFWLLDLAVTVNDWCSDASGALVASHARALLAAYHSVRPLRVAERDVWPAMLRAAALRFWLSRLQDKLFPRPGEMILVKDPDAFRRILLARCAEAELAQRIWPSG